MKRIIVLAFVVAMCFSLVACGSNGGSKATVDPVEEAKTKLAEAYDSCCGGLTDAYARIGSDNMSLVIDTRPTDGWASQYEDTAIATILAVNLELGLPSSLTEKMSSTRALDGTQSQDCGAYTVTWNYHPENGLKVIYEVNL